MASEKDFLTSTSESGPELSIFVSEFTEAMAVAFESWSLSCSLSTAPYISCSFSGVSSSSFLLPIPAHNCKGKSWLFLEDSTYFYKILTSTEI